MECLLKFSISTKNVLLFNFLFFFAEVTLQNYIEIFTKRKKKKITLQKALSLSNILGFFRNVN